MPFLAPLMNVYGCKQDKDDLFHVDGGKRVIVARCNHKAGRWEITPEGQKLIDKLPKEEPVAEDLSKLQPHQLAQRQKNIAIAPQG